MRRPDDEVAEDARGLLEQRVGRRQSSTRAVREEVLPPLEPAVHEHFGHLEQDELLFGVDECTYDACSLL